MFEVYIGFEIAAGVAALGTPATPEAGALAPTEAEVRRAIAANTVQFVSQLGELPETEQLVGDDVKRVHVALVVNAPSERRPFLDHVTKEIAKAQRNNALSILLSEATTRRIEGMFATLDAYRAWAKL